MKCYYTHTIKCVRPIIVSKQTKCLNLVNIMFNFSHLVRSNRTKTINRQAISSNGEDQKLISYSIKHPLHLTQKLSESTVWMTWMETLKIELTMKSYVIKSEVGLIKSCMSCMYSEWYTTVCCCDSFRKWIFIVQINNGWNTDNQVNVPWQYIYHQ